MDPMRQHVRTMLVGIAMGAAEIVPGVSGGTIAFVSGVYDRLVASLRQATPMLIADVVKDGFGSAWRRVDGTFLVVLFGFMGIGILLFANLISYVLEVRPVLLWSFFFGLVLASSWVVGKQVRERNLRTLAMFVVGGSLGLLISGDVVPVALTPTPVTLFLGGAVAVCAWILPGMSGSFILLVLGLYAHVIDAIKRLDVESVSFLALGCAVGLMSFSQVLSRLLADYRGPTLSLLIGFMLGSLKKLWPWRHTTSYQMKSDGASVPVVQVAVAPSEYLELTGMPPEIGLAIAMGVVGVVLVLLTDWISARFDASSTPAD